MHVSFIDVVPNLDDTDNFPNFPLISNSFFTQVSDSILYKIISIAYGKIHQCFTTSTYIRIMNHLTRITHNSKCPRQFVAREVIWVNDYLENGLTLTSSHQEMLIPPPTIKMLLISNLHLSPSKISIPNEIIFNHNN